MPVLKLLVTALTVAGLLGIPAIAQAAGPAAGPAARPAAGPVADDGAYVQNETWVDSRTVDLTISSPSLGTLNARKVRLLLPPKWSRTATRTWPTLFLLHGGLGTYTSWSEPSMGNVLPIVGNTDVITVLPGSGCGGGYVNWWNFGQNGPPAWDTYHVTELTQILSRAYRANDKRAIAGPSMGGFGAMGYAARHPTMFQAVGAYSGAIHTLYDPQRSKTLAIQGATLCVIPWRAASGDPTVAAERPLWEAYNPYNFIPALAQHQTKVYVSVGDGECGELDGVLCTGKQSVEDLFNLEGHAFVARAQQQNVAITAHFYRGQHVWGYWRREFEASFPTLMGAIGATPTP